MKDERYLVKELPTSIWIRYVSPLLLAIFFGLMIMLQSLFKEPIGWAWYGLIWMTTTTHLIWEFNLRLGAWLNAQLDWHRQFLRRLVTQLVYSVVISLIIYLLCYLCINTYENIVLGNDNALSLVHLASAAAIGFMLIVFINVIQIGYQLIQVREMERLRLERYQKESINARLESLRQQIDPHFLFNNFSTLYSLIHEDPQRAGDFLLKLSDVYRLVLEHLDREWVSVREELALIHAYGDLLCLRYGTALDLAIQLPRDIMERQLMPFALQLLVENAVKHNQLEAEHPLQVKIYQPVEEVICVENNLLPRSSVPASGRIGLKNLDERYRFRTGRSIAVQKDRQRFAVAIPLLENE